jgi:hypothetical protein
VLVRELRLKPLDDAITGYIEAILNTSRGRVQGRVSSLVVPKQL